METGKGAMVVVGGLSGGAGTTWGVSEGIHQYTYTTVGEKIKEEEGDNAEVTETEDKKLLAVKVTNFRVYDSDPELKTLSITIENSGELETWCQSQKRKPYKSAIMGEQNDLLHRVKTYCYLTIRDKLGNKALPTGDNFLSLYNQPITKLASYAPSGEQPSIDANHALNTVKNLNDTGSPPNPSAKESALMKWCSDVFQYIYKGKLSNKDKNFELSKEFCTYPSTTLSLPVGR